MKKTLLMLLMVATPAFAGTSSKVVMPPQHTPSPSLWSWFVGGSVGYLIDTEEPMYHLHIGVDSPYNLGGWDVAFFLEVGYFDTDASFLVQARDTATAALFGTATLDYEAIPFTANVKLERSIGNRLNAYVGAGVGFALVDATLTMPFGLAGFDDSDTVFACQVFAGLQYDVSEAFELYTGVRWMYFGSTDNVGSFDDVLVELGGRINF